MHFDASLLRDRAGALEREWLLTDASGGYAASTVLGCGTRRYHGLWVPALHPPVDRRVVLSHLDEHFFSDAGEAYLSTTEYAGGFYPDGSALAETFDLDPLPRLVSRFAGFEVEREVLLLPHGGGVCVTYRVRGNGPWAMDLGPMLALRSMHALGHHHNRFRVEGLSDGCGFRCLAEGMPGAFLWVAAEEAEDETPLRLEARLSTYWYYGVLRRVERERGYDYLEDLLMPGRWMIQGRGPGAWHVFCSFDPPRAVNVGAERSAYLARLTDLLTRAGTPADERLKRLVLAADAFLVRRRVNDHPLATVIAGYPWFGDWGRDALIALPGLALETGWLDAAEKVLRVFASAASLGMIPNVFDEHTGQPHFNSVDASLWFLQAVASYLEAGGQEGAVREALWPVARQICERYRFGTRFGIRADDDGLLTAGSADTQLTWMDAKSRGWPVTPRFGKAVEVNALWISGLGRMRDLAERLGEEPPTASADLDRLRQAFEALFWNDAAGCLYDVVFPDGRRDAAIRPNQIFAVALPHAPLGGNRARAVVRTVRDRLLTPRGLRTLSTDHPAYRGRYAGDPDERDAAYHQGTVWPWLLGPYADALFAVEPPEAARDETAKILEDLLATLPEAGIGFISEVFDGDPPHRPGGCFAQAWSVAAAIHLWRRLEAVGGVP